MGGVWNPTIFIGEPVTGATVGAPLAVDSSGNLVSGLTVTQATASADTTTTSTSQVLINGMTLTPAAGTYMVWFSTSVDHSNQVTAITTSIYVGGVQNTGSIRSVMTRTNALGANTLTASMSTGEATVTVNGSQAIEARWSTTAGTATAHQRTLTILRIS